VVQNEKIEEKRSGEWKYGFSPPPTPLHSSKCGGYFHISHRPLNSSVPPVGFIPTLNLVTSSLYLYYLTRPAPVPGEGGVLMLPLVVGVWGDPHLEWLQFTKEIQQHCWFQPLHCYQLVFVNLNSHACKNEQAAIRFTGFSLSKRIYRPRWPTILESPSSRSGTSFQFFPGGGQNFDRLPRGGGKIWKKKCCSQKHKIVTIFQNSEIIFVICQNSHLRGGAWESKCPLCPPPQWRLWSR